MAPRRGAWAPHGLCGFDARRLLLGLCQELEGKADVSGAEIPKRMRELDTQLRQLQAQAEGMGRPKPVIAPPNRRVARMTSKPQP